MHDHHPLRLFLFPVILLGGVLPTAPAAAHKLFVFAAVQDRQIQGEVYVLGGEPVAGATVTILDPAGREFGRAETDEEGKFSFKPRCRCDHKLVADAGLGHQAEYVVETGELPADLPVSLPPDAAADQPADKQPDPSADRRDESASGADEPAAAARRDRPGAVSTMPHVHSHAVDAEALSQQIAALRRDLDKWKAQLRLQDILGGIGYILGIMGLVFYFLGVRHKEKRVAGGE